MGRMSLSPGFRFSPTDVELILYYLKRKIMGRKFHYEAIGEVNIYKYSPWELPDKSLLKNKDLEWFFFCPREKKYASGVRIKRATESGFWKTTGKDRTISCNGKTVGTVKTLIFHLGHAPKGERTNWVIHEYRILDDQLAEVQNNYVLCKVFEKNGLGPKNGAQYGAPFCEADWEDDSVAENSSIPSAAAADGPWPTVLTQNEEQCFPVVTGAFGSGNGALTTPEGPSCSAVAPISMGSGDVPEPLSTPEEVPSSSAVAPISVVTEDETTDDEMANILGLFVNEDMLLSSGDGLKQNEEQCLPLGTGLFGSIYGLLPMPEEGLSSPVAPTSMVAADETTNDEMARLLGLFSDEDMLHSNENCLNQDDVSGNRKRRFSSISEGLDLHDFDHDLDIYTGMNGDRLDFFGMQYVDYSLNSNLPYDTSNCIELDDLLPPLDCSDGATETHLSSLCQMDCSNGITGTHLSSHSQASTSYSHENLQQLYSETRFAGINQYNTFYANNLAVQPYTSEGGVYLDEFQTVDHQFYQGSNVSYDSDLPFRQLENAVYTPHHMMERVCMSQAAGTFQFWQE